jgi:hypothetical protein
MVERVEAVAQLRLEGKEFAEIAQFCAAQGWPHGVSQTYLYIRRADALLDRYAETNRNRLFGQRIARRNALWSRAMAKDDLRMALAVEMDQTKLLGFYPQPPTQQAVGPPLQANGTPALSEEDRAAIWKLALARLGEADTEAITVRGSPADRQRLLEPRTDPERCGDDAGRLANETNAGAEDADAAPGQPAEWENP